MQDSDRLGEIAQYSMYNMYWWIKSVHWSFGPFFGPLEFSQGSSSYSIFFPLLSGFYRVVKNICRLSQTQFVAVFRGQGRFRKIRNNWLKLTFQRSQKIFLAINSWIGLKTSVFSRSLCVQKLKNSVSSKKEFIFNSN